jgi:hypothetical protein
MKKILFLLLLTVSVYGQNPSRFAKIQITGNTTSATATKVNVQEANGEVNTQTINTGFNKNIGLGASDIVGATTLLNQYSANPTDWTAQAYTSGSVVFYGGKQWYANSATVAGDVPASSAKWSDLTFEGLYAKPVSINHNDTGNIQGGAVGDYQHVTTADKTNWNGKQNAISGTANYLTKFGGGGVVASQIFDNGTNVGLGTTTPNTKLHIQGISNSYDVGQLLISEIDNPNRKLSLGVNNLQNYGFIQSLVSGDNYYPLHLNANGGPVLVGTSTNNGSLLQVNGNITANVATLSNQVVVKSQLDAFVPTGTVNLTGNQSITGQKGFNNAVSQGTVLQVSNSSSISSARAVDLISSSGSNSNLLSLDLQSTSGGVGISIVSTATSTIVPIISKNNGVNTFTVDKLGNVIANSYTGGATLTGTPTAPTATAGTNTTQLANTAFVTGGIATADAGNVKLIGVQNITGGKNFNTTSGASAVLNANVSGTGVSAASFSSSNSGTVANFTAFSAGAVNRNMISMNNQGTLGIGYFINMASNSGGTDSDFISAINSTGSQVFKLDKLGNVTANSFIKSGGTANQMLMANGSTRDYSTLPAYADNAAAIAGGLAIGALYRTLIGLLAVVY